MSTGPAKRGDLLSVEELTIAFGDGAPVVDQVSFQLSAGEVLGIIGESGSGKSITALSLLGLLPDTARMLSGRILYTLLNGQVRELRSLDAAGFRQLRRSEIGLIFQEPLSALNPTQRVGKQIMEAVRRPGKLDRKDRESIVINWLTQVQLPDPQRIMKAYPHELSGGQRQRVLIAMAMLNNPRLLVADEPTTALDTVTEAAIIKLLKELTVANNTTLIFISHDLALVRQLADKVILMKAGKVIESGRTNEVFSRPKTAYAKQLLRLNARLNFQLDRFNKSSNNELVKRIDSTQYDVPVLRAEGLEIKFPLKKNLWGRTTVSIAAVESVTLEIYRGEFLALIGESGCGKSSLVRGIAGLQTFDRGTVLPNDVNIQMVFQDPFASLTPNLTVGAMINEVIGQHHPDLQRSELRGRTITLLDSVDLDPDTYYDRLPKELSGGQRQRIAIARALAAEPDVLVCDEAVSALDASLQSDIMALLQNLKGESGLPILFISHDLALVANYADRILVMEAGRIVESADTAALLMAPATLATKKLISAIHS
ncbi:MAG: ABC transporter ATP-binding protein [Bacteroidota bacterium]